jgi:hypothetical protein
MLTDLQKQPYAEETVEHRQSPLHPWPGLHAASA